MRRYLLWVNRALAEINATPPDFRGSVIWRDDWCTQNQLCLDISYLIQQAIQKGEL